MAAKKVGELIKEARTKAGLSQTALAEQVGGLTGSDIGKAERGEKELSQTQLKAIAKATGVTQKSLLEAPKGGASASSAAKKTTAAKTGTTTAKKTTAAKTSTSAAKKTTAAKSGTTAAKKTSTAKKTASSTAKTAATTAVELTSAEKTMLNAYRKADAETRKAALKLLKGEQDADILSTLLQSFGGGNGGGLLDLLGNLGKK
ncbi:MAG: helix-turn-helix transcriptional regulator [Oscillospiraceae bacterium]|nr:helix-turn-helix transcriptional regulator [Oscillospiraceae bacterium]